MGAGVRTLEPNGRRPGDDPCPLGGRRGKGALLESARFYWTRCEMRRSGEDSGIMHGSRSCNPTSRAEEGLVGSFLQGFFVSLAHCGVIHHYSSD